MNFGHVLIIRYSMYIRTHIVEIIQLYNLKVCSFLSPAQKTPDPQKGVSEGTEVGSLSPSPPATKPKPSRLLVGKHRAYMHVENIISAHYYEVGVAFDIELCLILTKKYAIIIVTNLHETISLYNKIVTQCNQH